MRASFIHIADTHLGYEQYGVRERFNDFSRAFWQIAQEAIERRVNFVVIAGDLFNKRSIDAITLTHATEGLQRLHNANIPVIAIEGNHDRSYYRDSISWLQYLCYQNYLILLNPIMQEGVPQITPWQRENMLGAYVDLLDGQLRIYGLPWQGSATARSLEGMAQSLHAVRAQEDEQGIAYRLLAMHTGIEGIVPRIQGLPTRGTFERLRNSIDYLALGHVHKPYEFDGWLYNPGSPETCGAEEAQWEDRGYYYVEIDTEEPERIIDLSKKERTHHAERIKNARRPFLRYDVRVDTLSEPDLLYKRLEDLCRREGPRYAERAEDAAHTAPVVLINLNGTLSFDASALDQARMEEMIRHAFQPIFVRIDNHASDPDYLADGAELDGRDRSTWHDLERRIFEELIGRDSRYLEQREEWSNVLTNLKQMALTKEEPSEIAQFLRTKRATLFAPTPGE